MNFMRGNLKRFLLIGLHEKLNLNKITRDGFDYVKLA
jgi:hypothetical protein